MAIGVTDSQVNLCRSTHHQIRASSCPCTGPLRDVIVKQSALSKSVHALLVL